MLGGQSYNSVSFADNLSDLKQNKQGENQVSSFEKVYVLLEYLDWDVEVNTDILWMVPKSQNVHDILPLFVNVSACNNHPEKDGSDREEHAQWVVGLGRAKD